MLGLLFITNLLLIERYLDHQTNARTDAIVLAYRTAVTVPLASRDYATLRDILDGWRTADEVVYIAAIDPDGAVLAASGVSVDAPLPALGVSGETHHLRFPIEFLGQHYGDVQLGLSSRHATLARDALLVQGVLIVLAGMLLSYVLLVVVSRYLVRPLHALAEASARVSQGDYSVAVNTTGISELDQLSESFNGMTRAVHSQFAELEWRASHDPLTQVFNRRAFETHLQAVLGDSAAHPVVVLYIDLDQFKAVNDSCGHAAGDELLVGIAQRLSARVGRRFLARLGGDEFGVVLTGVDETHGAGLAAEIIAEVRGTPFIWEGRSYRVGASIGVASSKAAGLSPKALMIAADTACFGAKELGRNRVRLFDPNEEYFRQRDEDLRAISHIDEALAAGRFVLFQQRLMPLSEGLPAHAEVLLRVRNAEGGIEPPGAFIRAAERYNLMGYIDRWVVEACCRQLAAWQAQDTAPVVDRLAINVSGASLSDERFPDFVASTIRDNGVDPERLCFEITESCAIASLEAALGFIDRMRKMGASVALDDFGSGLSSFAYLKRFEVDYLKIDGLFVTHLDRDPADRATVAAMVTLARANGLRTVAEFVSSAAILEACEGLGIDYAQGFHCHRPEPLVALVPAEAC
nr:EAL domain-containing protein [Thauera sp.]